MMSPSYKRQTYGTSSNPIENTGVIIIGKTAIHANNPINLKRNLLVLQNTGDNKNNKCTNK